MSAYGSALWIETLKVRRSGLAWITAFAFLLVPAAGGLFMFILKDPEGAKNMGLIGTKAQIAVGTADWTSLMQVLRQGTTIGGAILLAFFTAWLFGREFSDHTLKEVLAVPTSRSRIVWAKLTVVAIWALALPAIAFGVGVLVGFAVDIPGWGADLVWGSLVSTAEAAALSMLLLPWVAFFAGVGRGYMSAIGWTFFTVFMGQIAAVMGWGDWFPWSVPALISGAGGSNAALVGAHSYASVIVTGLIGAIAVLFWWRSADHVR